jgi:integrase
MEKIESQDIKYITTSKGIQYPVRTDRRRVFMPDEWIKFIGSLKDSKKPLFDFMLNTGCRFDEGKHIRPMDFDFSRNNVRLWKTKTKAKKGEKIGKPRTISLSTEYAKRIEKYINKNKISPESYIFNIQSLQSANMMLKRTLKNIGIKDYYNFSTHNIRKTHGMYLKALGIDIAEICTRLGHDYNTFIAHYGSADIFSEKDMRQIKDLLGDLYSRQRRY